MTRNKVNKNRKMTREEMMEVSVQHMVHARLLWNHLVAAEEKIKRLEKEKEELQIANASANKKIADCLNDVKFILRFRVSCLATIGAFLLSAILLCFLGTVSIVSSETPLSELSGSMMNPAVVLIIPFFGLGTAIDTKVFFV